MASSQEEARQRLIDHAQAVTLEHMRAIEDGSDCCGQFVREFKEATVKPWRQALVAMQEIAAFPKPGTIGGPHIRTVHEQAQHLLTPEPSEQPPAQEATP